MLWVLKLKLMEFKAYKQFKLSEHIMFKFGSHSLIKLQEIMAKNSAINIEHGLCNSKTWAKFLL